MKSKIIISIAALGLVAAACTPKTNTTNTTAPGNQANTQTNTQTTPNQNAGTYKDYSPDAVVTEQKAGNKVVLFFHAPWCPFCRAADAAFRANLAQIPAGVTILKTDYDSNADLKTKYGVTYQHTFVQIDSSGNQVAKWNGGDIDNVKKYVK